MSWAKFADFPADQNIVSAILYSPSPHSLGLLSASRRVPGGRGESVIIDFRDFRFLDEAEGGMISEASRSWTPEFPTRVRPEQISVSPLDGR